MRAPDERRGDLDAQLAANRTGRGAATRSRRTVRPPPVPPLDGRTDGLRRTHDPRGTRRSPRGRIRLRGLPRRRRHHGRGGPHPRPSHCPRRRHALRLHRLIARTSLLDQRRRRRHALCRLLRRALPARGARPGRGGGPGQRRLLPPSYLHAAGALRRQRQPSARRRRRQRRNVAAHRRCRARRSGTGAPPISFRRQAAAR